MSISTLIGIAEKLAPSIATLLGSPIAGVVVSMLGSYLGVPSASVAETLSADPDAKLKLDGFVLQYKTELASLAAGNFAKAVEDTESARARDLAIVTSGKTDWVLSTIALVVVVGFFLLCGLNYFLKIGDDHVLIMLIGQVSSGFLLVLGFYFGSSKKQG